MDHPADKSPLDQSPEPAVGPDYARFLLAAIVDSSDDAMISKDLNSVITSWNEGARHIFGYTASEIVGQSILRLIPEELHSEEYELLKKLWAGERVDPYETVRFRRGGAKLAVSVAISPVKNDAGQVIGVSEVTREIPDHRPMDDSCFRLAAIVDSADDAIISKDLNGIIESWNDGARRMFGYTSEEMIGQPILRLIPKDLQYEEEEILKKLRVGERIHHYETVRVGKEGNSIAVSVTISPITDDNGKIIGASKIARDISDRKRVEKVLLQAEKFAATGRMAASIAHEINNPLESLMNLIYLARQNSSGSPKAQRYLLTAEKELERVSHIARQTLGYYRDTGSPTEVHLHDLIENILTVYHSKLITHGITVETDFRDMRKIVVRQGEMIQVFSNIIANALDAMRQGGKLNISIRKTGTLDGDGLQTIIRDQGTGIEQEYLEKIFEPFFTTKGNLGTGIGLWVAKQLTEQRGGQISVTSSTIPGTSGTSISIYIPFVQPAVGPGEQGATTSAS